MWSLIKLGFTHTSLFGSSSSSSGHCNDCEETQSLLLLDKQQQLSHMVTLMDTENRCCFVEQEIYSNRGKSSVWMIATFTPLIFSNNQSEVTTAATEQEFTAFIPEQERMDEITGSLQAVTARWRMKIIDGITS